MIILVLLGLSSAARVDASKENVRLLQGAARQATRGDTATALDVVERVLNLPGRDEDKAYALFLKGVLENGRGRRDTAEAAFRRIVVEYPASSYIGMSLAQLGLLLYQEGKDTSAVRVLEPVAASFPDSAYTPAALVTLVRAADRANLDRKAIRVGLQFLSNADKDPNLVPVLSRVATLLLQAGRAEEAWSLIQRIEAASGKKLYDLDLPTRMLAIGCLTGIGQPDSALRLVEELRRSSGEQILASPRMHWLVGQAELARGDRERADTIFSALLADGNLAADGISRDSVLALAMSIERERGSSGPFFAHALERIASLEAPERALETLHAVDILADSLGETAPLSQAIDAFGKRFSGSPKWREARLIQAGLLARSGRKRQALAALAGLRGTETDSLFLARVGLAAAGLYLGLNDTLRAEAEFRDYLSSDGDPLANGDSVLLVYAGIKHSLGEFREEESLLARLIRDYPASRYWESADAHLEQLRHFDLTQPARAADELFDLIAASKGEIPPERLAEIAAGRLADYDRAAAILRGSGSADPALRGRLAEYLYLSGLRAAAGGATAGNSQIMQVWSELTHLLSENGDFSGRDAAVRLYLEIYRERRGSLSAADIQGVDKLLRAELPRLAPGAARSAALLWLGERYQTAAAADSGYGAMVQADSSRMMWNRAIDSGGEMNQVGRAFMDLARSVESAGFAGALDSAAHLYGSLNDRFARTRWASLAGLRLAAIHLDQERYSVAYEAVRAWIEHNPYAANNFEARSILAAASFHTGRFGRAALLFAGMQEDSIPEGQRAAFQCYRIRSLTEIREYAAASHLLIEFQAGHQSPRDIQAAATAAVQLYLSAGNSRLAGQYMQRIPEESEFFPLARVMWLNWMVGQGGDLDKTSRELERFRKAPWNSFYRVDPALMAYRGLMAAYMAVGKPDKVAETRNDFRKTYPERRAGLSDLMLDEIEYLTGSGQIDKAASLFGDLKLLFNDVYSEDRLLWVGAELASASGDMAVYGSSLEQLATQYSWSPYTLMAKQRLVELYIAANQVDQAARLLDSLQPETVPELETAGIRGQVLGGRGDWPGALVQFRRRWAIMPPSRANGAAVLDWARAALKDGRSAEAREILTSLWSPEPGTVAEARFLLTSLWQTSGEYGRAIDAVDGLRDAYPDRTETVLKALYQRGLIQEAMGDKEAAASTYRTLEGMAGERSDWSRSARDRLRAISGGVAQP